MSDLIERIAYDLTGNIAAECCYRGGWSSNAPDCICIEQAKDTIRAIQDAGWAIVPKELTAENGMKHALIGEFSETVSVIDENGGDDFMTVSVTWPTIKEIHRAMIKAAPDPMGEE